MMLIKTIHRVRHCSDRFPLFIRFSSFLVRALIWWWTLYQFFTKFTAYWEFRMIKKWYYQCDFDIFWLNRKPFNDIINGPPIISHLWKGLPVTDTKQIGASKRGFWWVISSLDELHSQWDMISLFQFNRTVLVKIQGNDELVDLCYYTG